MKKKHIKIILGFAIIILITLVIMICPVFYISNINITGLENLKKEQIIKDIELDNNTTNIFAFNSIKSKNILEKSPYIQNIKITKKLPDTINIDITERKIRGYVPYMNSYLYISDEGRVIDVQTSYEKQLPVVVGLNFSNFTLGEILSVDNKEAFDVVVELSKLMTKYKILEQVIKVDVLKPKDLHLYVNNIDVLFGTFDDLNWKISTLNEIIKKIPVEDKGFLDISDSNKIPRFTYLT